MYGRIDKKKALTLIEGVISPYIGKTMAQASTQVHCEKLGIVTEELTTKDVEALLDRLAKAMTILSRGRRYPVRLLLDDGEGFPGSSPGCDVRRELHLHLLGHGLPV